MGPDSLSYLDNLLGRAYKKQLTAGGNFVRSFGWVCKQKDPEWIKT